MRLIHAPLGFSAVIHSKYLDQVPAVPTATPFEITFNSREAVAQFLKGIQAELDARPPGIISGEQGEEDIHALPIIIEEVSLGRVLLTLTPDCLPLLVDEPTLFLLENLGRQIKAFNFTHQTQPSPVYSGLYEVRISPTIAQEIQHWAMTS